MKELLRRVGAFVAFGAMLAAFAPATAGGVAVTLTPNDTSTSPQDVTISWTASGQYVTGTTIIITTDPAFTSISDLFGGGQDTDINDDGTADGAFGAPSANSITYTLSASTGLVDFTMALGLRFAFDTTPRNYQISVLSSSPVDYGSALLYVNGGNDVFVSATVPAALTFSIRTADDTSDTNTCALGGLSLNTTSTCGYRLRISTNAANGFQATVESDHNFGTGYATMTPVTNDGAMPAAGTEAYGIAYLAGATEGGRNTTTLLFTEPVTEDATPGYTFQTDPSPVPVTSTNFLSHYAAFQAGPAPSSVTTTSLVEHAASISAGTAAGYYSHTVTYAVTGSF
ncbi:hypothetical protein L0Y59_02780 [Candidatus Uhrbacteria bacterium]|nr:hypothetical protein [Candidatus Uhrbacteria bacterium]